MKYLQLLVLVALPMMMLAQKNEGTVLYTQTIKLDIQLDGEMAEQLKAMIPSSQTFKKIMYFTPSETLYKDVNPDEDGEEVIEEESEEGTVRIKMVRASADSKQYTNLKDKTSVESKAFMGRKFLISGDAPKNKWKLTQETKVINGYTCMKATTMRDSTLYIAWFTTQIPVSAGPSSFNGLPGLILQVGDAEKKNVIKATKVNLKTLKEDVISKPTKGKKVTQEAFEKVVEEKTKEMVEQNGSGNMMQIKIRRN